MKQAIAIALVLVLSTPVFAGPVINTADPPHVAVAAGGGMVAFGIAE